MAAHIVLLVECLHDVVYRCAHLYIAHTGVSIYIKSIVMVSKFR